MERDLLKFEDVIQKRSHVTTLTARRSRNDESLHRPLLRIHHARRNLHPHHERGRKNHPRRRENDLPLHSMSKKFEKRKNASKRQEKPGGIATNVVDPYPKNRKVRLKIHHPINLTQNENVSKHRRQRSLTSGNWRRTCSTTWSPTYRPTCPSLKYNWWRALTQSHQTFWWWKLSTPISKGIFRNSPF